MTSEKATSSIPNGRLASLDGMRGIAALMVALYHWGFVAEPIARPGYLAVDFFFALSGYILALIYAERLSIVLWSLQFMALRIIRFYPIYFAGYCLGMLRNFAMVVSDSPNAKEGLSWVLAAGFGLFMLPLPFEAGRLFPLNVPAWTLFLELAVNLLFALGMVRWSSAVLVAIMVASAAALLGLTGPPLHFDVGYSGETFLLGVARLGFSFPVGLLLFRAMQGMERRQSVLAFVPMIGLSLCLFFEAPPEYRGQWEALCVFIVFPLFLAGGIKYELPNWAAPTFLFLGGVSYAVYAIHGPLILFIYKAVEWAGLGFYPGVFIYLAVLLCASHLLTVYFDGPVRKGFSRWRSKRAA